MEKIIEKRIIKELHHTDLVDVTALAKSIADDIKKEFKLGGKGYLYHFGDGYEWGNYTLLKDKSNFADENNNVYQKDNYMKKEFDDEPYYKGLLKLFDFKGKNIEIYIREVTK